MNTATDALVLSRSEAANALRVSLRMVDYLLASGALRGTRIGRRVVIAKSELDRFLNPDTASPRGSAGPSVSPRS
jgi:excisionase family DNA binding protein